LSDHPKAEAPTDYDSLMRANLTQVFGELDAERRLTAIERLYGSLAVTGIDVAHFRDGLIHSLFVFLVPPNGA